MKKFTRTITVLASSAALTFSGMGIASAQSSTPGDLGGLSSRIFDPDNRDETSRVERELHNAAEGWARRTTNRNNPTLTSQARNVSLPRDWNPSPVQGIRINSKREGNIHYRFYQVEKNQYRRMVDDFNSSGRLDRFWDGQYGVNVTTSGHHHFVTVAFHD